jgi:hypothetical protein
MITIQKIAETSSIITYKNNSCKSVDEIFTTLNLQQGSFVVLINGHKALANESIQDGADIIFLPKFPGLL